MSHHQEHHFVPQFYLRQFSEDGRRVVLFNFDRMSEIQGASIRGQCSRRNFYAFAPGLEQRISVLEAEGAAALRGVRAEGRAPVPGTERWSTLLLFAVFQKLRTAAVGQRNDVTTDYLAKLWAQTVPALRELDPDQYEIVNQYPVALPLAQTPHIADLTSDLEVHLFTNETALPFITSDDPVVLHNTFCEGIDYRGVLGWNCSGIQAFWPISPHELLLFYDNDVYRVGRLNRANRETALVRCDQVRQLNRLQILNAHKNVYYRLGNAAAELANHCAADAELRPHGRTSFVETEEVEEPDGGSSEILHFYERMLPIRMKLDCVALRRRANRIPLHRRGTLYRRHIESREEDQRFYSREPLAARYPIRRIFDR